MRAGNYADETGLRACPGCNVPTHKSRAVACDSCFDLWRALFPTCFDPKVRYTSLDTESQVDEMRRAAVAATIGVMSVTTREALATALVLGGVGAAKMLLGKLCPLPGAYGPPLP